MTRNICHLPLPREKLPAGQPEPVAARIGDFVMTSAVPGINAKTGELPDDPESQFGHAFENLNTLLEKAGADTGCVGLVTVFTPDREGRAYINKPWLEMFPSESDRPARKTNHAGLPDGLAVQVQAVAIVGAPRKSLGIPGLKHKDPLPMGARVGDYVFSSVFAPEDPATGKLVEGGPLAQIERAFDNGALLMEAAGGSEAGINHYWVFMKDFAYQPAMVEEWVRRFPTFGDRPARKTLPYDLPGETQIQTQLTGLVGGKRTNFEVPGVGHHDPIPMGSRVGKLLQSSGIYGIDPADGKVVDGRDRQTDMVQRITLGLLEQAGGRPEDVVSLTVMVQKFSDVPYFRERLKEIFPDPESGPALHYVRYRMPEHWHLQFHVTALLD